MIAFYWYFNVFVTGFLYQDHVFSIVNNFSLKYIQSTIYCWMKTQIE